MQASKLSEFGGVSEEVLLEAVILGKSTMGDTSGMTVEAISAIGVAEPVLFWFGSRNVYVVLKTA